MSNIAPLPTTTLPPRPRRWLRFVAAFIIFFAGTIAGAGLTVIVAVHNIRFYVHHPEAVPARITKYLSRRLDLSTDQATTVETLIAKHQHKLQQIRASVHPQVASELSELRAEVSDVLTPDQRDKWDAIYDEALDRWFPPPPPASTTQPS
jgi:hypothetical protein